MRLVKHQLVKMHVQSMVDGGRAPYGDASRWLSAGLLFKSFEGSRESEREGLGSALGPQERSLSTPCRCRRRGAR